MNKSKSLPWDIVEKAIYEEIKWLEETIEDFPFKQADINCRKCIFRKIAILILSRKVKAKDIKSSISLFGRRRSFPINKPHGKEWHFGMMKLIATYFRDLGHDVVVEPNLTLGQADLGVFKRGKRDLFIEVGTVSIYKLLVNLESMKGSVILVVLDSNHAVEFSILDTGLYGRFVQKVPKRNPKQILFSSYNINPTLDKLL